MVKVTLFSRMIMKVVDISFKSQIPSNVHQIYCDVEILEVAVTLLCWRDNACRKDLEETLFTKIGTRVELDINNSTSNIGLVIQNVSFQPEDTSEKLGEKFSVKDVGYGYGSGHIIFITTLATIIGISIGLGLVGLAVLKTRVGHHPLYLGTSEDLQHITSTEDITIIQGKNRTSQQSPTSCNKIFLR